MKRISMWNFSGGKGKILANILIKSPRKPHCQNLRTMHLLPSCKSSRGNFCVCSEAHRQFDEKKEMADMLAYYMIQQDHPIQYGGVGKGDTVAQTRQRRDTHFNNPLKTPTPRHQPTCLTGTVSTPALICSSRKSQSRKSRFV